jgi:hypothetical protein
VATNTAGGNTMKLATAINTLKQEFGLYNVESYRQHEGQFKPYGFTMDTDKFLIEVVHPMNRRTHRNYIQRDHQFLPINVDEINNLGRIFIRVIRHTEKDLAWDEYMTTSIFEIKRGDVDFVKNLLSTIA